MFPWRWQASEAGARAEGRAQGAEVLLPPHQTWGQGGPFQAPAKRWPPHCSLFQASLQEHPFLPHSGITAAPAPPSPLCLPPSGSPPSARPCRGPWEGHISVSVLCCPFPLSFHFKMPRPLHQKQEGVQGSGVLGFKNQRGQGLALGCTARPRPPLFSLCSVCSLSFLLPPPSPHFLQPRLIHLQDLRAH